MLLFENSTQIATLNSTRTQVTSEGIASPEDIADFDTDPIRTISNNLRQYTGRILDPNHDTAT